MRFLEFVGKMHTVRHITILSTYFLKIFVSHCFTFIFFDEMYRKIASIPQIWWVQSKSLSKKYWSNHRFYFYSRQSSKPSWQISTALTFLKIIKNWLELRFLSRIKSFKIVYHRHAGLTFVACFGPAKQPGVSYVFSSINCIIYRPSFIIVIWVIALYYLKPSYPINFIWKI